MAWKTFSNFATWQLVIGVAYGAAADQQFLKSGLQGLEKLKAIFGDRMSSVTPVPTSCYHEPSNSTQYNRTECDEVESKRTNDIWIADQAGGYFYSNWASCQALGEFCTLPTNVTVPFNVPTDRVCYKGSLPQTIVDVRTTDEVIVALRTAKENNLPVIIKNTGHDWKGRSAGPGTFAIATHNFRSPKSLDNGFRRTGCPDTGIESVFHFGAGETWANAYQFAHDNGLAILGGTCGSVGIAGWLHGGGHSPLTPTKGMGADNLREIDIVTPDGQLVTANECTNSDLFFAVRGGGGGTWGVVTRITYRALPIFKVHEFSADFSGLSDPDMGEFIGILTKNAARWSQTGWGGYIKPNNPTENIELVNTHLKTLDEVKQDIAPVVAFLDAKKQKYKFVTRDSWYDYFVENLQPPSKHVGGASATVASRLIPKDVFETSNEKLSSRLLDLYKQKLNMWIMLVAPTMYEHTNTSALHPTWATSLWSVRINDKWDQYWDQPKNGTVNRERFARVHEAMDPLREITPDAGVSMSEADVWERHHELTFWGKEKYDRLVKIKKAVDSTNLMSNWMAVGFNETADRYECYPKRPRM